MRQPRSACHPPVPGPLANSFINASWWFFRRSFLKPAAIYHPPKENKKKKGARKKNQPTLLRGRSGAQQPPALCPTAGLIRLLSSGKRLLAHRFSRQKDGQRATSAVILWWSVSRPWRVKAKLSRTILPLYQMVDFFLFLSFFPFFLLVVAFLFLHSGCASFSSPHRFGCCTAFFYLSGYKFLKAEVKKRTVTRCRLALEAVHASRPKLDFASP